MNLVTFRGITARILFSGLLLFEGLYVIYAECPNIRITGTSYVHDGAGNYDMMTSDITCSDRPVYLQTGGTLELYFADDIYNQTRNGWVVGKEENRCSYLGSVMMVEDGAFYADAIQNVWKEKNNGNFIESSSVDVICNPGFEGCDIVDVTDTMDLMGTPFAGLYHVTNKSHMCNGRNVYHYEAEDSPHLYSAGGFWIVGEVQCGDLDSYLLASVPDGTQYPEEVEGTWEQRDPSGVWQTSDMSIQCHAEDGISAGAIAGITIGCAFIVGGIIAGGIYFWPILKENMDRKKQQKHSQQQHQQQTASHRPPPTGIDNRALSLDEEDHQSSAGIDNTREYQPQYSEVGDQPASVNDYDNAINDVKSVKQMQQQYRENVI